MGEIFHNLAMLRQGQPPEDTRWLKAITVGQELWLDRFREHYLENYIRQGGSKVKILVGGEGTGKSHLLRCVAADAQALGYMVVFLNLRELTWRLSNIVELYKAVAAHVDREDLVRGLCRRVAEILGYGLEEYDGSGSILSLLVEREGHTVNSAKRQLRMAAVKALRSGDLSLPFSTLAYTLVSARMGMETSGSLETCWKWLAGEGLEAAERRRSHLYDRLTRTNGRVWLYALIRLLRLAGKTGVVVLIDNVEVLLERSSETGRYLYPPNATKDTYELIRQLIDDVELLEHFVLLLSGRREVLTDENRGFASYEALWMRLQSGLVTASHFNPWADIVDVDRHLEAAGGEAFAQKVGQRLQQWLQDQRILRRFRPIPPLTTSSPLRRIVMETAIMTKPDEEV